MSHFKSKTRQLVGAISVASLTFMGQANADLIGLDIDNSNAQAYIAAGNGDNSNTREDNLASITDPNNASSPFNGVVSIFIESSRGGFICTGAALNKRHILSAAHCVDENDQGQVINLANPDNRVRVVFNSDGTANDIITAQNVDMHPDYNGFNICSDGTSGCLNDDVAIIELDRDIPEGTQTYDLFSGQVFDTLNLSSQGGGDGSLFTMVGYGTRGDGYSGYYDDALGSPDFFSKLVGQNIVDAISFDDDGSGLAEVWHADFDGTYTDNDDNFGGGAGAEYDLDFFCAVYDICSSWLPEGIEANIGGGDSGGPSFVFNALTGQLEIAGINTFGAPTSPIAPGAYGDRFGGILMNPYADWINYQVSQVPTPNSILLFGLALAGLATARRKA
ncbi:trypsin-like serine protease [Thalassotalea sediminis]|uniref:trypsin-like serine protease n=1 Tax=Thalassotalea sediminis TaxID=1759089 RepID=UPI002573F723|nr:trypsin-like serine protease [Thalassotalea sediminis]